MKVIPFLAIGFATVSVLFGSFVGLGGVNDSVFPFLYFMKLSLSNPTISSSLSEFVSGDTNISLPSALLSNEYNVYLWSYCTTTRSSTTCQPPKRKFSFNPIDTWQLKTEQLPKFFTDSLEAYTAISRYFGQLYIAAIASTFASLVVGSCSMIMPKFPRTPLFPLILSFVASILCLLASVFVTVTFGALVGAFKTVFDGSGVHASLGRDVFILLWISFVFSYLSACLWFVGLLQYICFG